MLVSGVVLVGLFQLPPLLGSGIAWSLAHVGGSATRVLAVMAVVFARAVVYVLIGAFVLHLVSRAYWVALVGLDSVFPGGIHWERDARDGPVQQALLREKIPTLPALISRLDNFCSVIFAVGFATAFMAAFGVVAAGLIALVARLLRILGLPPNVAIAAVLLLFLLPRFIGAYDRRIGLRPGTRAARLARRAIALSPTIWGLRWSAPILLTLRTNVKRPALVTGVVLAAFFGGITLSFWELLLTTGDVAYGVTAMLPAGVREASHDYLFYADQRTGERAQAAVPFIQSDVVRDPYVRLFIPYDPKADLAALARCVGGTGADAARTAAALGCMARLHAVSVNGRPRPDAQFRFYSDPGSGLDGVLVYIPVADLPKGRNLLTIAEPRSPNAEPRSPPPPPVTIPFWL